MELVGERNELKILAQVATHYLCKKRISHLFRCSIVHPHFFAEMNVHLFTQYLLSHSMIFPFCLSYRLSPLAGYSLSFVRYFVFYSSFSAAFPLYHSNGSNNAERA